MSQDTQVMTYEQWFADADAICQANAGLSLRDLEDCPFADWFADGTTPTECARKALRRSGFAGILKAMTASYEDALPDDEDEDDFDNDW